MKQIVLILTIFILSASVCSAQETLENSPDKNMQTLVSAFIASDQFHGTVHVNIAGQTALEQSSGLADISKNSPNTSETQFAIASLTKPFTAILALQLVEAGKLELDEAIAEYFPDVKSELVGAITLRHLLTHTSGVTRDYAELLTGNGPFLRADLVRALNLSALLFEPGTRYEYSNTGYHLVTLVMETVTEQSYDQLLQKNICRPAGLIKTMVGPGENAARGYSSSDLLTMQPAAIDSSNSPHNLGAGGLFSTTNDLNKFVRAIADNRLLTPEMREVMLTAADVENGNGSAGMGWTMYSTGEETRLIVGTGVSEGYMSFLAWDEQEPTTNLALLINDTRLGRRGSNALFERLLNLMLGGEVPLEAPETPLYTFLDKLMAEGADAAVSYADSLDWSNPPVANAAASQAAGAPNGGVGESMYAWAPATADAGKEWLKLYWEPALVAQELRVQFTQIPGALTGLDIGGGEQSLADFRMSIVTADNGAPLVEIDLGGAIECETLTLHLDTAAVAGWPQIDAVGLVDETGSVHWADRVTASTSAFEASGVAMHDLPSKEMLAKLSRRLQDEGNDLESAAVLAVMNRVPH